MRDDYPIKLLFWHISFENKNPKFSCNTPCDRTLYSLSKVIDLKTQLSYFKNVEKMLRQKLGTKDTKQLLHNAVYMFSIGGNDYLSPIGSNSSIYYSYSQAEYVDMVIGNLTTVIKVV